MKKPLFCLFIMVLFTQMGFAQQKRITKLYQQDSAKVERLKSEFELLRPKDYRKELAIFAQIIVSFEQEMEGKQMLVIQEERKKRVKKLCNKLYVRLATTQALWKNADVQLQQIDKYLNQLLLKIKFDEISSVTSYKEEVKLFNEMLANYGDTKRMLRKYEKELIFSVLSFYSIDILANWINRVPLSDFSNIVFKAFELIENQVIIENKRTNDSLYQEYKKLELKYDTTHLAKEKNLLLSEQLRKENEELEYNKDTLEQTLLDLNARLIFLNDEIGNVNRKVELKQVQLIDKEMELEISEEKLQSLAVEEGYLQDKIGQLNQKNNLLNNKKNELENDIDLLCESNNTLRVEQQVSQEGIENRNYLLIILLSLGLLATLLNRSKIQKARAKVIKTRDKLEKKTKELELSYKELNHRIKNNLQQISSLVYLQTDGIENEIVQNLFSDLQSRIDTIKIIHQKLYTSDQQKLTLVDIADYVKELSDYIVGEEAEVNLTLESIPIEMDHATYIGLIINELLTNICKYVIDHVENPKIDLKVQIVDDNLRIAVSDNGPGFPTDFVLEDTSSFGLGTLVEMIVQSKNGVLDLFNQEGACVCIQLPFHLEAARLAV